MSSDAPSLHSETSVVGSDTDPALQKEKTQGKSNAESVTTLLIQLPSGEVARTMVIVVGILLGVYFVSFLLEILFVLFLGILLSTAIEPLVNFLRRGPFTRGSGVLAVYTVIIMLIGAPTALLAPNLVSQATSFMGKLPERLQAYQPYVEQLEPPPVRTVAIEALNSARASLQAPGAPQEAQIVHAGTIAAKTVINIVTVFVIGYYWLVERAGLKRNLLRLVPPERAKIVNAAWLDVESRLGGWVRGQLVLMLVVGILAGIAFFFLGLPSPILLAVVAGLAEAIPLVGPFIAFAPAVLVAFTISPTTAILTIVVGIVVQQFEGNVLVPRVMERAVGVSPLTIILGILIGAYLYGIPGAFIAVPLAAGIQAILVAGLYSDEVQPSQDSTTRSSAGAIPNDLTSST